MTEISVQCSPTKVYKLTFILIEVGSGKNELIIDTVPPILV